MLGVLFAITIIEFVILFGLQSYEAGGGEWPVGATDGADDLAR